MNRLDDALNRLAAELAETGAPSEIENAVLAEFNRAHKRRRARYWFAAAAAVAASVAGVWMVEHRPLSSPVRTPAVEAQTGAPVMAPVRAPTQDLSGDPAEQASVRTPPHRDRQVENAANNDQPFVPIPYVLPPAPYERMEVVRMELPVAALIAAGFRMRTADQGAQAEADVIIGEDGRARAVRLISISSLN